MYDKTLALHILEQINESSQIILERFESVRAVNDFTDSPRGMERLDSICMQLINIGESLKNIDKITNGELLEKYTQIDWKKAKGMRDIITHHYFDVNAEAIFNVCRFKIPDLNDVVLKVIKDIKKD